ncbi:MAG: hypothetical protein Q8P26_04555 [Candidatus Levybacteria bacterium]|nr:hypothetical protein [Candidatus Levybacteria bacterium]
MYSVEIRKIVRRTGIGAGAVGVLGAAVFVGSCIGTEKGVASGLKNNIPATATPTREVPTNGAEPVKPGILSSKANTGYEVVMEADGRIWQPNVSTIQGGTVPTEVIFKNPDLEQNQTRIFNGINARLIEDANRNGVVDNADVLVAGGVNGKEVTLKPGAQYIAQIGLNNGGFELKAK